MLVITLPVEGLKNPRDRSAAEIVQGFVTLKSQLLTDESVGSDVCLLVSADVSGSGAQSCVSKESKDR